MVSSFRKSREYDPSKPPPDLEREVFDIFPHGEPLETAQGPEEPIRFRPRYIESINRRIQQALYRALQYENEPIVLGPRSPYTNGLQFQVEGETLDADGNHINYFPTAYRIALHGGFVYATSDLEPVHWITCTCTAYKEHTVPCKHAALVYLYLLEAYERGINR